MHNVISPWVEHLIEWVKQRSIFIEYIGLADELSFLGVVPSNHEQVALWRNNISGVVWDFEIILDKDGLGHIIHNLV